MLCNCKETGKLDTRNSNTILVGEKFDQDMYECTCIQCKTHQKLNKITLESARKIFCEKYNVPEEVICEEYKLISNMFKNKTDIRVIDVIYKVLMQVLTLYDDKYYTDFSEYLFYDVRILVTKYCVSCVGKCNIEYSKMKEFVLEKLSSMQKIDILQILKNDNTSTLKLSQYGPLSIEKIFSRGNLLLESNNSKYLKMVQEKEKDEYMKIYKILVKDILEVTRMYFPHNYDYLESLSKKENLVLEDLKDFYQRPHEDKYHIVIMGLQSTFEGILKLDQSTKNFEERSIEARKYIEFVKRFKFKN